MFRAAIVRDGADGVAPDDAEFARLEQRRIGGDGLADDVEKRAFGAAVAFGFRELLTGHPASRDFVGAAVGDELGEGGHV